MILKSSRRIASSLLLSIVLAGCASGPGAPSPDLQKRIESAHSRSEHEALATYYKNEATTARAIAADHRKMAKGYQARTVSGKGGASMPAHCNAIVTSYESIAFQYEGMAESHQQMAKQAQP